MLSPACHVRGFLQRSWSCGVVRRILAAWCAVCIRARPSDEDISERRKKKKEGSVGGYTLLNVFLASLGLLQFFTCSMTGASQSAPEEVR